MLKKLFLSGTAAVAALLLVVAAPMAANASEPPPPTETVATEVVEVIPGADEVTDSSVSSSPPVADPVAEAVPTEAPAEAPVEDTATPEPEAEVETPTEPALPVDDSLPEPEASPPPVSEADWTPSSTLTFSAGCVPEGEQRVPLIFNYTDMADNESVYPVVLDGRTLPGDAGNFTIDAGTHTYSYTVTNVTTGESVVQGPFEFTVSVCDDPDVILVSPIGPGIDLHQQTVTIEDDPNFTYELETGQPLVPGVNTLGPIGLNVVIAVPKSGVAVDPNATTQWPFEFSAPQPPVFVTPPAPTQVGNEVTIPSEEGVVYQVDGGDIVAGGPFILTKDVCITALPDGVTFPDKAQTNWCFEYQEPYVPIVVEPTNPLAGAVACSDYDIPEIDGVIYGDPVVTRVGTLLTITITATPDAGFAFDGEQIRVFSVMLDVAECEGTPPITPGPVQPPVPPVDNAGPIVPPILAGENQPVSDKNTDTLAVTGAGDAGGTLLAAVALLTLGGGALMVRRRRQSA